MADRHIDTLPGVPATPSLEAASNQPPSPATPLSRPEPDVVVVETEARPRSTTERSIVSDIADRASYAAHYVQEHYLRETVTGLERTIRRYPAPSLAGALVAGFIVGRALRSR